MSGRLASYFLALAEGHWEAYRPCLGPSPLLDGLQYLLKGLSESGNVFQCGGPVVPGVTSGRKAGSHGLARPDMRGGFKYWC